MGGLESLKWMVGYITCRKTDERKEEASVSNLEEKIDWIHKCHEVELAQKESEVKKCEIRGFVQRLPPSDY